MTGTSNADQDCAGHPGLGGEFRTVVLTAIDRLGPLLDAARTAPPDATAAATCDVCPVCAVLAALRGQRTELSVRLAEHATGLLTVLRAALEEGNPAPAGTGARQPSNGRPVQHIPVTRVGTPG